MRFSKSRLFLFVGFLLIAVGIISNGWTVSQIALLAGIDLSAILTSSEFARLWVVSISFIVVGLPLILLRWRSRASIRIMLDVSVGFLLALVLLIGIDGGFYFLNSRQTETVSKPALSVQYSEPLIQPDEWLGYENRANLRVSVAIKQDSDLIADAIYSTDKYGRRITPVDNPDQRSNIVLFFGGSFTFGYGVNDDETLPYYLARLSPAHMPYNYGVNGYGPQQMLAKLEGDDFPGELTASQGIAIYSFIAPHVDRATGVMYVHNSNGHIMPFYTVDFNDQLVRRGTFVSGRPVTSLLYGLLGISQTAKFYNVKIPREIGNDHIRLTVRIIEEARDVFRRKFENGDFYVIIYPAHGGSQQMQAYLEEAGIKYLDYSDLIDKDRAGFWLPDGHPTAQTHRVVAERLVEDIGIGGAATGEIDETE